MPIRASPTSSGSARLFIALLLTLGLFTTIAVAWACRWNVQQHSENVGAFGSISNRLFWQNGDVWQTDLPTGSDGRLFGTERWHINDLWKDAESWRKLGVEWAGVANPAYLLSHHAWDSDFQLSDNDHDWHAPEDLDIPYWSSVESVSLHDENAVVEVGCGFPLSALRGTTTLLPHRDAITLFPRRTDGIAIGHPFDSLRMHEIVYRPIWPGLIVNTLFWTAFFGIVIISPGGILRLFRRALRRHAHACVHCGYKRHKSAAPICSECGLDQNSRGGTHWRRRSIVTSSLTLLIASLCAIYALEFQSPSSFYVTELDRAAFHGDNASVKDLYLNIQHTPESSLALSSAIGFAHKGKQADTVRLLLELMNLDPNTQDGTVSDDLILSLLIDLPNDGAYAQQIFDEYHLLEPEMWDDPDQCVQMLAAVMSLNRDAVELLTRQIQSDVELRELIWYKLFLSTFTKSTTLCNALLDAPPQSEPTADQLDRIGEQLCRFIDLPPLIKPNSFEKQFTTIRRVIRETRTADPDHPDVLLNCVTATALSSAIYIDDHNLRWKLLDLYAEFGGSPHSFNNDVYIESWHHDHSRSGNDPTRLWNLFIDLGVDVNGKDTFYSRGPALIYACQADDKTDLTHFLLRHDAVITDRMLLIASPQNKSILTNWLEQHNQQPLNHNERFPDPTAAPDTNN